MGALFTFPGGMSNELKLQDPLRFDIGPGLPFAGLTLTLFGTSQSTVMLINDKKASLPYSLSIGKPLSQRDLICWLEELSSHARNMKMMHDRYLIQTGIGWLQPKSRPTIPTPPSL